MESYGASVGDAGGYRPLGKPLVKALPPLRYVESEPLEIAAVAVYDDEVRDIRSSLSNAETEKNSDFFGFYNFGKRMH